MKFKQFVYKFCCISIIITNKFYSIQILKLVVHENDRDSIAYDGNAGKTEAKIKDEETNYFSSSVKYTLLYVEVTNYTVSNIEYIQLLH